jgi:hypothetical protein
VSDALVANVVDHTGASAASSVFVADEAPASQAEEWGELVAACTPSDTQEVQRTTTFAVAAMPGWDGYPVGIAALLSFLADGTPVDVLIPSPSFPCFLVDGVTVDETYAPIADVIAWVLANGRSPAGPIVDTYLTGRRVTLAPGLAAIYGAAAVIQSQSALQADFHVVTDGADVKVGGL